MVGEQLELDEDLGALRRAQPLSARHHARDRDRVSGIRLATRRVSLALSVGQERRHLDHFAGLEQMPRPPGAVAARSLDADYPALARGAGPPKQALMTRKVVGKFSCSHHPTELVKCRGGKRALVRVDSDRHTHPGLLPSARRTM